MTTAFTGQGPWPWLFAVKLVAFGLFLFSGLIVHLRGKVRHRLTRQFTDHSTFLAPYNNLLVYCCSAVPTSPFATPAIPPSWPRCVTTGGRSATRRGASTGAGHIRPLGDP